MGSVCCAPSHHHTHDDQKAIMMSMTYLISEQGSKSMKIDRNRKSYLDFDDFKRKFDWEQGSDQAKDKKYKIPYEVEIIENVKEDQVEALRKTLYNFRMVSKNAMNDISSKHHF